MRALGAEHSDLVRAQRERSDGGWGENVRRAHATAARFEDIVAATTARLPLEARELEWIAQGAEIDVAELWAQNLRGDLGRDGTGCSDVSFATSDGVVLGHNEDGDGEMRELIRLITLDIVEDPAVTLVWYPGMLPANSFVTTSAGLVFGMDHVPVAVADRAGCGRHFVARHAQRQRTGMDARNVLTRIPCAGGFAFDMADAPAGRVDLIESAAGRWAHTPGAPGVPHLHTNHLRAIDGTEPGLAVADDDAWLEESRSRLTALRQASSHARTAGDVVAALRAEGVRGRTDDLYTFSTVVVDTGSDEIVVQGPGDAWHGRWSAFTRGEKVGL